MILLPVKISCDESYRPDAKTACPATADAYVKLRLKGESSKLRGECALPDGWVESRDHYDDSETRYYCPDCGRHLLPWMYK